MKRSFALLVLISLTFLSGCGLTFSDFSPPDGSFKIKMPGTPVKASGAGSAAEAWEVVTGVWNFGVGTIPLPISASAMDQSQQNLALSGGLNGMASAIRGTVKSQNATSLGGFPGLEAEMSVPAGPNPTSGKPEPASTVIVRVYLVNSKAIMAFARSSRSITKSTSEVKTFFDSLVINATAPPSASGAPAMAGMPTPAAPNGMNPASAMNPANAAMMPPGSPGTYAPNGGSPMGTFPMPGGTYSPPGTGLAGMPPMGNGPGGTYSPSGTSPMPSATYNGTTPMPTPMGIAGTGTYSPNGGNPMPSATYNGGMPPMTPMTPMGVAGANGATGTYSPNGGTPMPMGVAGMPPVNGPLPGGNVPGMIPGQPGQAGNAPTFTGTPVTADTRLTIGDMLQVSVNGQWVDVKVLKITRDGLVQVRTTTRPPIVNFAPRNVLQVAPGTTLASAGGSDSPSDDTPKNDSPRTDSSALPNSTSAGSSKPRTSSPSKPAPTTTASTKEAAKGTGSLSLDGASIEELLKIIANKNEHRRIPAAEKLAEHSEAGPNADVAKKLVELLKVEELTVRAAVAKALEKWAAPETNDAVIKNLTGGTTEIRQSMMRILSAAKVEGSAENICARLSDKDDRKAAVESLIAFGEPAEAAVIKMLDSSDSKVKLAACDVLKEIGTADGLAALKKATDTWTGTDRLAARKAMQALEAKK